MTPCSTLEQRWSACRAPQYGYAFEWQVVQMHPFWCLPQDRPCTSPRRHQCRTGDYDTRQPYQYPGLHERDWCQAPLAGVRASDWLKELEPDDAG